MFKKFLCMGLVIVGHAYSSEDVPYYAQERAGRIKPDDETLLRQVRTISKVKINLKGACCTLPITHKTTVKDIKKYLQLETENLYAQWYEPSKLADVRSALPLIDSDTIHTVIVQHCHPPYIDEIELAS